MQTATNYEVGLLAGLLARPELAQSVLLSSTDFSYSAAGDVFDVVRNISNPTVVALTAELTKQKKPIDRTLLSTIFAVKDPEVDEEILAQYAEQIRKAATTRRLHQRVQGASELLKDGKLDEATGALSRALLSASEEMISGADPTAQAIVGRMGDGSDGDVFDSGLRLIDAVTGGLRRGHIWVISGIYGRRKTTVALNIVRHVLEQGKSVAYIALEDDDVSFAQVLMAQALDFNVHFFEVAPQNRTADMQAKIDAGLAWISDKRFRVYDAKKGVHNWHNLPQIIRADKLKYDTDLVVVDYVQALGNKYEVLSEVAHMLQRTAQENAVCMLELSQISGDDIKHGPTKGILPTKGATDFAQAAHVGLIVRYDKDRAKPKQHIVKWPHDLGSQAEIGIHMVKARRAANQWAFLAVNPESGLIHDQYASPLYPSEPGKVD